MFARVSSFEGPPEHVDDFHHALVEHMLPALRRLKGYQGVLILADRKGGKVLARSRRIGSARTAPKRRARG
jgi:hypothetical protein